MVKFNETDKNKIVKGGIVATIILSIIGLARRYKEVWKR